MSNRRNLCDLFETLQQIAVCNSPKSNGTIATSRFQILNNLEPIRVSNRCLTLNNCVNANSGYRAVENHFIPITPFLSCSPLLPLVVNLVKACVIFINSLEYIFPRSRFSASNLFFVRKGCHVRLYSSCAKECHRRRTNVKENWLARSTQHVAKSTRRLVRFCLFC
jgi:hypothetical protein